MPVLERRVQVLFTAEQYQRLEAEAADERVSVGSYIRASVEERLDRKRLDAQSALQQLWAWADQHPVSPPTGDEWRAAKDAMWNRGAAKDVG